MMDSAGRRQNHGAAGSKGQTHQARARHLEDALPGGVILTMPRLPESEAATYRLPSPSNASPCGRPRPRKKLETLPWDDPVDAIETRCGRSGHEHVALRAESQVVRGNAGFESRENESLAVGADLEDGPAAIADIKFSSRSKAMPVATPIPSAYEDMVPFGATRYTVRQSAKKRTFAHCGRRRSK